MRTTLILCFGLGVTVLASAGERAALWPEGKIPDFQPLQSSAATGEVKAPGFKAYYQWQFDAYDAAVNPAPISEATLRSCVGTYGPRTITLENGALIYQREGQAKRRMTALGDGCFAVDGNDNFRLRFLKEGGRIVAVEGYTPAGVADKHLRDK